MPLKFEVQRELVFNEVPSESLLIFCDESICQALGELKENLNGSFWF